MNLLETSLQWTDGMRQVARLYPAAVSSKNWPEIIQLSNSGQIDAAKALAAKGEMHPHIKAHNVIARRLRTERAELFIRIIRAEAALRALMDHYSGRIAGAVETKGGDIKNLRALADLIHDETVLLRAQLRIWFGSAVRDAAKMGYRHVGDAILPIFKANKKVKESEILADRAIYEAAVRFRDAPRRGRLAFGVKATLAARATGMSSAAIATGTAKIIRKVARVSLGELHPSRRIWDFTQRSEQDLKRIVAGKMAAGENPAVTARAIKKYISPRLTDNAKLGIGEIGQGIYRSPYRNAMRLARTEMNRTYVYAQQSFVASKTWLQGSRIDLSPNHDIADDCDDKAGRIVQPGDGDVPPFHPHCMCLLVPQIDPKYLGEDEEAA